jgi:hypothetical protein
MCTLHHSTSTAAKGLVRVGPGARPFKRSHLIAQLVEPIGAYLESPESEIAIAVQRTLFVLISNLAPPLVRDNPVSHVGENAETGA